MPCVNAGVAVGVGLDYLFARWTPLLRLATSSTCRWRSRIHPHADATEVGPDAAIMFRHDWRTLGQAAARALARRVVRLRPAAPPPLSVDRDRRRQCRHRRCARQGRPDDERLGRPRRPHARQGGRQRRCARRDAADDRDRGAPHGAAPSHTTGRTGSRSTAVRDRIRPGPERDEFHHGRGFRCWLRREWFGPLRADDRGITPTLRFRGQWVLGFLPLSTHEMPILLASSNRSGLHPPFPAWPIRCSTFRLGVPQLALPTA